MLHIVNIWVNINNVQQICYVLLKIMYFSFVGCKICKTGDFICFSSECTVDYG